MNQFTHFQKVSAAACPASIPINGYQVVAVPCGGQVTLYLRADDPVSDYPESSSITTSGTTQLLTSSVERLLLTLDTATDIATLANGGFNGQQLVITVVAESTTGDGLIISPTATNFGGFSSIQFLTTGTNIGDTVILSWVGGTINKWFPVSTSGNVVLNGTTTQNNLTLTGDLIVNDVTLTGFSSVSKDQPAGVYPLIANLATDTTVLSSVATGDVVTVADGTDGQIKKFVYGAKTAGTDTLVITPATALGFTTVTLDAVGDSVILQFVSTLGWTVIGGNGYVAT